MSEQLLKELEHETRKIPRLESEVAGINSKLDDYRTDTSKRFDKIETLLAGLYEKETSKRFPYGTVLTSLAMVGGLAVWAFGVYLGPIQSGLKTVEDRQEEIRDELATKTKDRFDKTDGENLKKEMEARLERIEKRANKRLDKVFNDFYMPRFHPLEPKLRNSKK